MIENLTTTRRDGAAWAHRGVNRRFCTSSTARSFFLALSPSDLRRGERDSVNRP